MNMDRNWLLKHLYPEKGLEAQTHTLPAPSGGQRGLGGEEGARQIAVRPGMKHSAVMLFFYLFLLWRPCESVEDMVAYRLCVYA